MAYIGTFFMQVISKFLANLINMDSSEAQQQGGAEGKKLSVFTETTDGYVSQKQICCFFLCAQSETPTAG